MTATDAFSLRPRGSRHRRLRRSRKCDSRRIPRHRRACGSVGACADAANAMMRTDPRHGSRCVRGDRRRTRRLRGARCARWPVHVVGAHGHRRHRRQHQLSRGKPSVFEVQWTVRFDEVLRLNLHGSVIPPLVFAEAMVRDGAAANRVNRHDLVDARHDAGGRATRSRKRESRPSRNGWP